MHMFSAALVSKGIYYYCTHVSLFRRLKHTEDQVLVILKQDSVRWEGLTRNSLGTAIFFRSLAPTLLPVGLDLASIRSQVAAPPMRGTFPQNQLQLDAGCRYALWETPGALGCLQGRWVVHIGTSNTILWWIQFAAREVSGFSSVQIWLLWITGKEPPQINPKQRVALWPAAKRRISCTRGPSAPFATTCPWASSAWQIWSSTRG